jgi:hypothetical protein
MTDLRLGALAEAAFLAYARMTSKGASQIEFASLEREDVLVWLAVACAVLEAHNPKAARDTEGKLVSYGAKSDAGKRAAARSHRKGKPGPGS